MQQRFIEIIGTGECPESRNKKHKFITTSVPNPKAWGDEIEKSFYEFECWYCPKKVFVPYAEAQKEQISVPIERGLL